MASLHPPELDEFLAQPDPSADWKELRVGGPNRFIELISQTWQGIPWRHELVIHSPRVEADTAILYITGGDSNPLDLHEAESLSKMSGLPVAMLFHIPNQPIWGKWEDDLIAHTFEQYLASGDPAWPLLLPMTKAAIRAMDAVQSTVPSIKRFVVTGASKRGWTTWLVGASGDPRVAGIAPMVYDNLNIAAQMSHQLELWGRYSPMIEEYTSRDLQSKTESELGERLTRMVDPYSYLDRLTMPKLIVNGANDPYWAVDALSLYWDNLPEPKHALIVPNAGHLLGDKILAMETIAAFSRACARTENLPSVTANYGREIEVQTSERAAKVTAWAAESADRDFTDCVWEPIGVAVDGCTAKFGPPDQPSPLALLIQTDFGPTGELAGFSLSAPIRILS